MTPGIARRLAGMLYEAVLLFAIAYFAGFAFHFASRGAPIEGALRLAYQALLCAVFGAYFLWCWLRGGQTLAMKAWRIRLVDVTPRKALLRFVIAALFFPVTIVWALFDRDRQFLHDRLAGTRLTDVS